MPAAVRPLPETAPGRERARRGWLIAGVALLALNLRPAVVAVAPLASRVRADTGLSSAGVSLLTTLPLLSFGLFALPAPRLARRVGLERALTIAIVALVAGIALRLLPDTLALFAGSALAGAGIATLNVLLAGLIKRDFPERTGVMMTLYTLGLSGGATAAAGLTVPLGNALHTGWRPSLALWGLPAAVAALVWVGVAGYGQASGPAPVHIHDLARRVWRAPLAWWVAAYMAAQSLIFYSLNAWLPSLLQSHGASASTAGAMLALFNFVGIGSALVVPGLATRRPGQQPFAVLTAGAFATGIAVLLLVPHAGAWPAMVVLGAAQGAGISLGLSLFVLRTRSPAAAAELSGMAQTIGYLVAALGPLTVGALHGATGGWTAPLLELLGVTAVLLLAGWIACRHRTLEMG